MEVLALPGCYFSERDGRGYQKKIFDFESSFCDKIKLC